MATTVTSIPKSKRETKYDYDTLFNGEIHRLVQGEDFDSSLNSFRGALYNRKSLFNKDNPEAQIGLKTAFRTENGVLVAYVQKTEAKASKPKAEAPAAPAKKAAAKPAAKKAAAKKVSPNPKVDRVEVKADQPKA